MVSGTFLVLPPTQFGRPLPSLSEGFSAGLPWARQATLSRSPLSDPRVAHREVVRAPVIEGESYSVLYQITDWLCNRAGMVAGRSTRGAAISAHHRDWPWRRRC